MLGRPTDQIPDEMILAEEKPTNYEIHELIIWRKEELQQQKSIITHIYKRGDKTDCSNYQGISLINLSQNIILHSSDMVNPLCK